MPLHIALTHRTRYHYDRRIAVSPQIVRLRPAPHCRTPILSYALRIAPEPHFINWQQDPFGNFMARVVLPETTEQFSVTVDLVADMAVINPFDFFVEEGAMHWPFPYDEGLRAELQPYLAPLAAGPELARYLAGIDRRQRSTIDFLCDINRELQQRIGYLIRMEPGVQTTEQTLTTGCGSCRDTSWLLVQILRHLGLAARFVSGYLVQLKPDIASLDGPSGAEHDFTDLHAWAEVYVPGAGWIGLDPTSGLLTGEGHIPLAATPAPGSAAPITGSHERAEVTFDFDMSLKRVLETPRVTKPYSEDVWRDILTAGDEIDARLDAADVRLSMGGEPTFVSVDDMDGEEWNTAATGPMKRRLAEDLVRRLAKRFAQGGLLHFGQGKWYPGEQLPRWSFAVYWRADGMPLWQDHDLIARERADAPAVTLAEATRFTEALCTSLGLPVDSALPAYEDAAHFALVERKLPVNTDPTDNRLSDPAERARIVEVFDRGIDAVKGFVLPIQVWQSRDRGRSWGTERWTLRRSKLFLVPGDSPIGYRLPMGSLAHLPPMLMPQVTPRDPFAPAPPLPERHTLLQERRTATVETTRQPSGGGEIDGAVRTALAVEPRDGRLCVFLPPLEDAEDYAALLASVEDTARQTRIPVQIEGYAPPADPRLNVIKVTPDPGVIEVNVHPATRWRTGVEITETLYEEARLTRLGTEKFMLDGRHTGTGGGNHIVMGGMTPADSPFLRRPDLLASIVAFWQTHPSLSYLFSGLFIGPTSQAPRLDEGRHEYLYELEIALAQIPQPSAGTVPPWLVDRIFRNLLVDVTGNTHRAEICIDKLYAPDGPTGRLGLIEFRSFEMPPHPRMSLAQQLLLRALIARFWDTPYRAKLVRWGTALHDRFMLPHYIWADFCDVVDDLKMAELPVHRTWFEPHFAFRFPLYGQVEARGVTLELRQALEPWHVLGEEGVIGGTARYVDSSLERVQVRVRGMIGDRFVVTCNGHAVPLTPTGTWGEAVAGVRYRAWQPAAVLHPTIAPHVPLAFDIVDTWSGRSIGGCRYHVAHPGGRNFESFPVNAYEAEGRRLARFDREHTPGMVNVQPRQPNPDYPLTLDLRRP